MMTVTDRHANAVDNTTSSFFCLAPDTLALLDLSLFFFACCAWFFSAGNSPLKKVRKEHTYSQITFTGKKQNENTSQVLLIAIAIKKKHLGTPDKPTDVPSLPASVTGCRCSLL